MNNRRDIKLEKTKIKSTVDYELVFTYIIKSKKQISDFLPTHLLFIFQEKEREREGVNKKLGIPTKLNTFVLLTTLENRKKNGFLLPPYSFFF
jgi:hypothetical protein